jgi:hypothetical protein
MCGFVILDRPVTRFTVTMHNPMKAGTFHGILSEVAEGRSVSIESIIELF